MVELFEVVVYEGAEVGHEVRFESLDIMDCYEYISNLGTRQVWYLYGPDFKDKSELNEAAIDYRHALQKNY